MKGSRGSSPRVGFLESRVNDRICPTEAAAQTDQGATHGATRRVNTAHSRSCASGLKLGLLPQGWGVPSAARSLSRCAACRARFSRAATALRARATNRVREQLKGGLLGGRTSDRHALRTLSCPGEYTNTCPSDQWECVLNQVQRDRGLGLWKNGSRLRPRLLSPARGMTGAPTASTRRTIGGVPLREANCEQPGLPFAVGCHGLGIEQVDRGVSCLADLQCGLRCSTR